VQISTWRGGGMQCRPTLPIASSLWLGFQAQPAIELVQAHANISRSAVYAFAVHNAISLHTCMLS